MPRRSTSHTQAAEEALRALARACPGKNAGPLPTVRELAQRHDVSSATISRLLGRLTTIGAVWQHPNGRFYPAGARSKESRGFPIVVLGRQMQHWSFLYQEILQGVSEECAVRGSALILLSSAKLVIHATPEYPPVFASRAVQATEIRRLTTNLPNPCGGILYDHLWTDAMLRAGGSRPGRTTPAAVLVRESRAAGFNKASIDVRAGARMLLTHLARCGYRQVLLGVPFEGDPAIDAWRKVLREIGAECMGVVDEADCRTPSSRRRLIALLGRAKVRSAVISTEDNVTAFLWHELRRQGVDCPGVIGLASVQGTAAGESPITRLRYDYQALGRGAVVALLEGVVASALLPPRLILGQTTGLP